MIATKAMIIHNGGIYIYIYTILIQHGTGYPYYRKVESAGRSYEAHLYRQLSGTNEKYSVLFDLIASLTLYDTYRLDR